MKGLVKFILPALLLMSCSKDGGFGPQGRHNGADDGLYHDMIVLGKQLENPYRTENVRKAYTSLYPTKSKSDISSTDLYVRFLPADEEEYDQLVEMGVEMIDHPVDFEIVREGDYYHDPAINENEITWQYAVVPCGFEFPDIKYEILSECFIAENSEATKAGDGIDWEAVEMEAYRLTGNEGMIETDALTKAPSRATPSGRITIVDEDASGVKPFGVSGVRVSCNVFVKFAHTYTDRDGFYTMPKKFSMKPRYRLVFKNNKGFSIGFNLVLVPASVSTLGKGTPSGLNYHITRSSDSKLYKRAVVNNAAYDYYTRCGSADMNISTPPSDLRLWLFHNLKSSSAIMMHHGTVVDEGIIGKYLGAFSPIIRFFSPDITLGVKGRDDYKSLYDATCHELAHASHFSKVQEDYWNEYIKYITISYIMSGGETYGSGTEAENAGHCEIGEMWAYYVESMMHKERYGGEIPAYGTSYWFYPQIFRYLEDRGLSRSEIFAALDSDVSGRVKLQARLIELYPQHATMIRQVFNRYK